ncbi:hypothetical protein SFC57_06765 [Niallia circulans]|uniref:hypothetical protein n=1 Tax=Niallia circulans TaxID=1397 RepID=UPI00155FF671|nr:hypothetical protein [Niallia circulans]NRG34257.1 hypothetical protein [Niallia circulans]
MKLFIEYILDEIEQIGLKKGFRTSLSSSKNEENYLRGTLQYFDKNFFIHFVLFFSYPEKNPNLTYTFWILNHHGNEQLLKKDNDKESEEAENKKKKIDLIKEHCLSEINVNISKGEEIQKLFKKIETVLAKEVIMS